MLRTLSLAFLTLILLAPAMAAPQAPPTETSEPNGVDVLFLMSRNFGVNYYLDRDRFEEYGWNVTTAGLLDTIPPCPFYYAHYQAQPMIPDLFIPNIADLDGFDAMTISSSSAFASPVPFDEFLDSKDVLRLIANGAANNVAVFTVCHGSRLLAAADVIRDRRVICGPKWKAEIEAAGGILVEKDHPPVIAGNIVTGARGQYNNDINIQAIATVIEDTRGSRGPKTGAGAIDLSSSPAQFETGDALWAKTLGSAAADGVRALARTGDGGYLTVGYSFSEGSGDADLLAICVDADGNRVWSRLYGGVGTEYGYGVAALADGFVITGYTTSFGSGSKDVYLVRIDDDGNEVWSKTFGGPSWDVGNAVCATDDGSLLVVGFTHSSGAGEEDVYLLKTDRDGNEIWSRTYGGARSEIGQSVRELDDQSIMVGGVTGTFAPEGNSNPYLLKLDRDGNEIWSRSFGTQSQLGHGYDWCRAMEPTDDGGAIMVGYSDAEDLMNVYTVKVSADGEEEWAKMFGVSKYYDFGTSVCLTADGGYAIGGTAKLVGTVDDPYDNQVYIVKLDASGEIVWQRQLGGDASDWGSDLLETADGGFIVVGHTYSTGAGNSDAMIMKISGLAPPPPPEKDTTAGKE